MLKLELYENKLNKKYTICETIDNDISNQNIILIDELIDSGSQMKTSINYLKTEKQVLNVVHVVLCKPSDKEYNFKLLYATNIQYNITAWGYDN
jgi:hypoxanthine-guanine phosphoribosyltransferase